MVSQPALNSLLDELVRQSWAVSDVLLPRDLCSQLLSQARRYQGEETFAPAAFGRAKGLRQDSHVRGDKILWLDREASKAEEDFLSVMEGLMEEFRRQLFVPVREYEAHFAIYTKGQGYTKHLDRFRDADERELSTVLFLNEGWRREDGGELLIFDPEHQDRVIERILPQMGRFVVFRSATVPHQVLPPSQPRYSIAGWMRRNRSAP